VDPEFQRFFDTTWTEALHAVSIPGAPTASWDRRAAWLLWTATDQGRTFAPAQTPPKPDHSAFD